jgi:heterodisulfide reductase subunit A
MEKGNSVLVVGGGVAGIQASLDLGDRGFSVYLVEKTPSVGGRMAQLDKTFPTMDCSICILAPKMVDLAKHSKITLLMNSMVQDVASNAGSFHVKVLKKPRFVDEKKCIGCGICATKCPIKRPNTFDMGLGTRKAIYIPFPQSAPLVYTIEKEHCLYLTKGLCRVCEKFCDAEAINFDQKEEIIELDVGAIIVATGYDPYNPSPLKEYGYGKYKNVLNSMELERLLSTSGPTGGKLARPSDNVIPNKVAFIQCVGSRSLKGDYPYCSSVCCMYATKEATLIKEHERDSDVYIFYTDIRAFGKGFREFVNRAKSEWGVKYYRAKPSELREDPKTKDLLIEYEETITGELKTLQVNLVVLCTGLVPDRDNLKLAEILGVKVDEYGFFEVQNPLRTPNIATSPGVFLCGCCQGPKDIPDSIAQAKGAAARAAEFITWTDSTETPK